MSNPHGSETRELIKVDKLYSFRMGTNISCQPQNNNKFVFDSWSGADLVSKNNASVKVSGNRLLLANFKSLAGSRNAETSPDQFLDNYYGIVTIFSLSVIPVFFVNRRRRRQRKGMNEKLLLLLTRIE